MFLNEKIREESTTILDKVDATIAIPEEHRVVALHREQARYLIAAMLNAKRLKTLEIGLGWGYSAACIQAAGSRDHTIVTVDHDSKRQQQGMKNAMAFGVPRVFIGTSDIVLPSLLEGGEAETFDLILIDGGHRFDEAFVDVHFAMKLCSNDGIIVIDDTWMPSVKTVCSWVEQNYPHIRVLADEEFLFIFQKRGADQREWTHWKPFIVAPAI